MSPQQWSRVKELLGAALSSTSRTGATVSFDSEDPEVRREVERLMEEFDKAGSFLGSATREMLPPTFREGQLVAGRYLICERLGQGGMGEVFRAEDRELGGMVALKTILPTYLAHAGALGRFRREIAVARKVTHPNVCRVFDLAVHPAAEGREAVTFLTMEFLDGETLSERIRHNGRFDRATAFPLIRQMADGIHAAHRAGIVHRDLKSANVMLVAQADGTDRAVIMDFGLARDTVTGEQPASLTAPHHVVGTPAYMAPEMFKGSEASAASDLYAFGLILFEMATGRRPASPDSSPSALVPNLDPAWAAVIRRCLQKDPAERFATALDAAHALEPAKAARFAFRAPGVKRASAIAAALLLCALAFSGRDQIRAYLTGVPTEKHIAILPFTAIGSGPEKQPYADGLTETVTSQLSALGQFQKALWVVPASEIRSRKLTSVEEAQKAFGVTLVITGNVQVHGDTVSVTANLVDARDLKQLQSRTIELSTKSTASLRSGVVEDIAGMLGLRVASPARRVLAAGQAGDPEAYSLYQEGLGHLSHFERASVEQAVALLQRSVAKDPNFALAYTQLGAAYLRKYNFTKNATDIDLARKNVTRAIELDGSLGSAHSVLANIYSKTGHLPEAIAESEIAVRADPSDCTALVGLAQAYSNSARYKEAEATFQRAIAIRPDYWLGYHSTGLFYYRQNRYDQAEQMFKAVAELTPESGLGYRNLGAVYLQTAQYDKAEEVLKRSLALSPDSIAYSNLSTCYWFQGRFREAVPMLLKSTALDPKNDRNWRNLGDTYMRIPEMAAGAPAAYRKAFEAVQEQLAVNPVSPDLLLSSAVYSAKLNDRDTARKTLQTALSHGPLNPTQLLKAAVVWELAGERNRALTTIGAAVRLGLSVDQVAREPELAKLYRDPNFTKIRNATLGKTYSDQR